MAMTGFLQNEPNKVKKSRDDYTLPSLNYSVATVPATIANMYGKNKNTDTMKNVIQFELLNELHVCLRFMGAARHAKNRTYKIH